MSSTITYTPHLDATPEGEIAALASVYAFLLRHAEERKKAACGSGHDARKEISNGSGKPIVRSTPGIHHCRR